MSLTEHRPRCIWEGRPREAMVATARKALRCSGGGACADAPRCADLALVLFHADAQVQVNALVRGLDAPDDPHLQAAARNWSA